MKLIMKKVTPINQKQFKVLMKKPKNILGKVRVDDKVIKQAKKALFNFDIEKYISKKDLLVWK